MASVQEQLHDIWGSTGLSSLQQALPGLSLTANRPQPQKWTPFTGHSLMRPPTPPNEWSQTNSTNSTNSVPPHLVVHSHESYNRHEPRGYNHTQYDHTQYHHTQHNHTQYNHTQYEPQKFEPRKYQYDHRRQFELPKGLDVTSKSFEPQVPLISVPQSIPQPIPQSVSQISQPISHSVSQSIPQPTSQSVTQSVPQPPQLAQAQSVSQPPQLAQAQSVSQPAQASCRNCSQPAKTGFALWVGNLPPKTTMKDLCWLFSTPEIQSIYLIHRTGCAFVNYTSEEGLVRAEAAFRRRGGRIRDQKLVIKAQRDAEPAPNVTPPQSSDEEGTVTTRPTPPKPPVETLGAPSRYFICKSLTVGDLEAAQRAGTWTTQIHNRAKINEAFHTSQNVYFIFSANRSSAFYGVARMETPLGDDDCILEEPTCQCTPESSFIIEPTPATENALDGLLMPAGRIVQDVVRGCIFWEVENCPHVEVEALRWTGPCRIRWATPKDSVVEFSATKQFRNPLNQNKPIKVARDGTEIEPSVAARLVRMFQ